MSENPFTVAKFNKAEPIPGRRYDIRDPLTPGLVLTVMPSGAKVFYWVKWVNSRTVRERIGPYPDEVKIEGARKRAKALNAQQTQGVDPALQRRQLRAEMTLGELWTLFLEEYAKPRKRSWPTDEKRWRCYLKEWENRRLSTITQQEVAQRLASITNRSGPIAANRTRALLRKMWTWAVRVRGLTLQNPAAETEPNSEKGHARKRFLQPAELQRLWKVLAAEPDRDLSDLVKLLLLTGVRSHNGFTARWADLDLEEKLWTIPAEFTKAKRELLVPLAPPVVDLLVKRQEKAKEDAVWVFPSKTAADGHVVTLWKRYQALLQAAEVTGLTVHDLRRSFASYALHAGVPIEVIAPSLGHSRPGGVTALYSRESTELVRLGVDLTVKKIIAVATAQAAEATILGCRPAWAGVAS
ncbi:MAG: tyrosine-type recombinase/integrase [Thermoanaerobaculaceae bacterium]|nr:tyrosine-type recombinase/integrase [Thermoanaerobaculaceae bacterium]